MNGFQRQFKCCIVSIFYLDDNLFGSKLFISSFIKKTVVTEKDIWWSTSVLNVRMVAKVYHSLSGWSNLCNLNSNEILTFSIEILFRFWLNWKYWLNIGWLSQKIKWFSNWNLWDSREGYIWLLFICIYFPIQYTITCSAFQRLCFKGKLEHLLNSQSHSCYCTCIMNYRL